MSALNVFVTDGDQRPALAITRSLGRRGIAVIVGAEERTSLASASKYCARHVTYPSPYQDPNAFDRFLLDFVERERVDVVMPVTDVTTSLVAKQADDLRPFTAISAAPFAAFDFVSDKSALLQRAADCGIPIPRTLFVNNRAGLTAALDRVEYPAVIKPSRSRIRTHQGWLATTVHYARHQVEVMRIYREVDYLAEHPSMIQERVVGPGVGVFFLFDRGRLVTAFAHRRLREKPPSGGVSVLCESVALDPALVEYGQRLLGPLGWQGVAMLEFKQDGRTGQSFLMEVNGRFWGSLQLAIDAGVDFPFLSYRLAARQPLLVPSTYEIGVKSRWLLGDLDHLLIRLFHANCDQHLPEGMPSRPRALIEFLRPDRSRLSYDVIDRDDPRPGVLEARQYVHALFEPLRRHLPVAVPSPTDCPEQESQHAGVLK